MAGDRAIYGGGDAYALSQKQKLKISSHDQPPDSIFASGPANPFIGSRAMVSFGGVGGVKRSVTSFYGSSDHEEIADEYLDEYLNQQEKKRRLSVDQVQFLERNFETDNKLESDRKIQLAKELGLKPRQIAIWFQNRRARWKTKQMETDYETLHASYESLKTDYDSILKENEKLKAEVLHLKHNGISENTKNTNFELCNCQELMTDETPEQGTAFITSEAEESDQMSAVAFKNEEQTLTRSDVTDVDNPHSTDVIPPSFLQSIDSSYVFELIHPYSSKNGEDNLDDDELLQQPAYTFHGFPVDDHEAFNFWSY